MSGDRYPHVATDYLVRAYQSGATLRKLAKETGMHPHCVRMRIVRAGCPTRARGAHNKPKATAEEYFMMFADEGSPESCWNWRGPKDKHGYGRLSSGSFRTTAQRYAVMRRGIVIPDGHQVDHLCFNPSCVNPAHLEVVTADENRRRRRMGPRSHCYRGHPLTPENTLTEGGARRCRICRTNQRAKARATKGEE